MTESRVPQPDDTAAGVVQFVHELADAAAACALRWFRTRLDVELKSDESPVTVADRSVEALLRGRIAQRHPTHGILGEEEGASALDAEYVWVLDPIDGTKSFISGSPLWGNLIALLHRGRPVLGCINIPFTGERWLACAGDAAHYARGDLRDLVRTRADCDRIADARIYTTSPDAFDAAGWAAFDRLSRRCALRRFGGDCYAYGQLAAGQVDLVVEAGLQPYDYLALAPVVEAAGGVMTDWSGAPLGLRSDGRVVAAANPALHRAALAALAG